MRKHRIVVLLILLAMAICGTLLLRAQAQQDNRASMLKPPKGSNLALVVFEDLQCPDCANASPLLHEAAKTYKIPLVVYDFPLPMHNWSFQAALMARYFDSQSKKLGDDFRAYIFQNQPQITPDNLRSYAEKFAKANGTTLPFVIDPQGKFAAEIKTDQDLGMRIGIAHTPTIYVVTNKTTGVPFVEVVDRSELYAMIDEMKKAD